MGQLHKDDRDFLFVHLCAFVFLRFIFFFKEGNVYGFLTIVRNVKRQN